MRYIKIDTTHNARMDNPNKVNFSLVYVEGKDGGRLGPNGGSGAQNSGSRLDRQGQGQDRRRDDMAETASGYSTTARYAACNPSGRFLPSSVWAVSLQSLRQAKVVCCSLRPGETNS